MTNPYQVLGISPNASEEEIKEAYRRLSQQYHPDLHSGNSVMEDIANQKMTEINQAYDEIMNMRRSGGVNTSSNIFLEIRKLIENGNYTQADKLLEENRQDAVAEWNFLKGTICLSRGWMNDALTYYEKAARLDPSNREYQSAYNQLRAKRTGQMNGNPYARQGQTQSDPLNCLCNACQCLMCADCLCDCI